MPAKIEFTKEEIAEIVRLYEEEKLSSPKIAKYLGKCSQQVIGNILHQEGVKLRGRRVLTDGEEEQLVKLYQSGEFKTTDIARLYRITVGFFRKMLVRRGIPPNRPLQYELDEHAFDNIDCEETAYWLGFIAADGCVYRNRLSIALTYRDRHHIAKIRTFLKTDRPIRISEHEGFGKVHKQATFYLNNDHLTQRLTELGIVKERPNHTPLVSAISDNLLHHFLRGYIDGDGSIGRNRPRVRIIGKENFLIWARDTFQSILGNDSHPKITQMGNIHVLGYYGLEKTRRILKYLYKDATIYLERKKILADQWM